MQIYKKFLFSFLVGILLVGGFLVFSRTASAVAPAVGDTYKGGKVAYILQSGDPGYVEGETRGFIAAPSDLADAPWGCNGTTIGADGTALGTGKQNTIDIMAGCSTPGIAARLAGDLVLNGYSDWYLPSKDELNKLYLNQVAIGGFDNPPYFDYWTSTEFNSSNAWGQYFANSNQYENGKNLTYLHVRAIRSFSTNISLGTADSFAVLGGSGITNTGTTIVTGDVGTHPTATETGFGPGADSVTITGTNHNDDATTQSAKADLATAYTDAAGQASDYNLSGTDLGGHTYGPGVYTFDTSAGLTGTLTLDGGGNPNAVFVFQIGSTLTTASSSHITLINGAQAHNVFWQVGSSATLGTTSDFKGSILASASITDNGGSTINGRLLADADNDGTGAVTLNNTTAQIHAPGSITIESATLKLTSDDPLVTGDNDANGYANIGDHISVRLTVSNTDGGCNSTGTVAHVDLTKYGGSPNASMICYSDNGGVHDILALGFNIVNAGASGIDVGVNSGSSVTVSISDADDSTTTTTNNLGDGVDDLFTIMGVDTIAPVITNVTATQHDAVYKAGDTIDITVSFSENVYADWYIQPTLTLNSSAAPLHMAGGNGSSDWTFEYVVGAGDSATTLDYVDTGSFALGATTIKGNHGGINFNDAILDLPALGGGNSLSQRNITIDAIPPTVTKLGDGSAVYSLPVMGPGYGADLVFSEELSLASKTAIENALTAGTDQVLGYTWVGSTLEIRANLMPTFSNNVFSDLIDLAGNTSSSQLLIHSLPPSQVWVDDDYTALGADGGHLWGFNAFNNVTDGVGAVAEGGTVQVYSGTYHERSIWLGKTMTLIGDEGDTVAGPGVGAAYIWNDSWCEPAIKVAGNSVQIKGLKLNTSQCDVPTVYVYGGYSGTTISQNEILGVNEGIFLDSTSDSTTISGNTIHDINHNGDPEDQYAGIFLDGSTNNTISENDIYDNYKGVEFSHYGGGTVLSNDGTVVENNNIHLNHYGIYFDTGNQNSTVTLGSGNTIAYNTEGIYIVGDAGNFVIHGNYIHDNPGFASGLHVENATFVDAASNWWGDASGPNVNGGGPGTGEAITTVSSPLVFYRPFCTNDTCSTFSTTETDPAHLTDHFTDGVFTIVGADYQHASSITVTEDLTISVNAGGGNSSVDIPAGTVITRSDLGLMNGGDLTAGDIAEGSLAGLGSGVTAEGALQWGIPSVTLEFNPAITLHIFVGVDKNGQTLDVKRSPDGLSGWTSDGIVAPATCLVAGGICTFQATKASTYASTVTASTPPGSGGGGGGGSVLLSLLNNQTKTTQPIIQPTITTQSTPQAPVSQKYVFIKTLKYGMRNKEVFNLQKILNLSADTQIAIEGSGSPGHETNYFGKATQTAIKKFQKKYGLKADGIVGPKMRAKLMEIGNKI